jgi:hypothetical protein
LNKEFENDVGRHHKKNWGKKQKKIKEPNILRSHVNLGITTQYFTVCVISIVLRLARSLRAAHDDEKKEKKKNNTQPGPAPSPLPNFLLFGPFF